MHYFIDAEPPCFREVIGKQVWKDAITKQYQYILEMMYKILFRDQKGILW
jgi:hypothetical protein